ncbi:MAG: DNA translocase FtsK [Planctomycetia bacterium]
MTKRPFDPRRDGGALLLFVAGTLVSVLMVLVLTSEGPLSAYTGTAAIAEPLVNSFGAWPTLLFAAGLTFLGARTFVSAGTAHVLRHMLGLAGVLIGSAVVLGAFAERAGGALGALVGGQIAGLTHPMVGALAGVAVGVGIGWYVWLRPDTGIDAPEEVRQSLSEQAAADKGVTSEEAAGLVPEEIEAALEAGRRAMAERPVAISSPYPEDVRLRGEIPAGAKPLQVSVRAAPVVETVTQPAPQPVLPQGVKPLFSDEPEERIEVTELEVEESVGEPVPLPAQPSWETTGLNAEDEPVDAYGTPLSVIKTVRPEGQAPAVVEPVTEPPVKAAWESEETTQAEALLAEFDQLEEEVLELEAAVDAAVLEESEEELEEALEDESEFEEVYEEQAELPDTEEESEEVSSAPARAPIAQTTIFDFAPAEESVELFPEEETKPAVAAPQAELESEPEPEPEPEMVLQPQAVSQERALKAPAIDPERARLLREIGCLFVDNGRVAVSMLQRKYSMEFDDACKVLDELQDLGLIGPYLGGQRRDILLSREQWLEKVGAG